jgi:site-specific DNA-cytosine methylase
VGYAQVHFFAGIGGWPYALRQAALSTGDIKKAAHAVLVKFDKTAAAVYQAATSHNL